ncbi:tRNA uracil 4-sulfurtransferase ThiI [Candidatus Xianfuyuplasma coldseepsis]|uniref:Probable tRNA sulfurtransferase n=1 Tax=Candidatus Xianfuyuplasma coldseepsis TaxID=2782163 RepID=A0A7L7KNP6_9MOLU|nr:tRNA uracil 4-sulfurtransferase ThiI [Xianfuyuplasma coldseepsis]QMS84371.1 tRNA 4-thiouridine(8) synthase ThiI [Xianfuyuplasma coldseepsis]
MYERILVRYGDLTLKGKNKKVFVERVNQLIREKVNNPHVKYEKNHDRLYIVLNGEHHEEIIASLDKVSGLSSYSFISKTSRDMESIKAKALEVVQGELGDKVVTFKVETKRADKTYPLQSPEISKEIAGHVLRNTETLLVDVHNPELTLFIEVRHHGAYLYCNKMKGMGGFPVGVAGKGLLMMSGGIDSPVAGFLAMKQGIEIECIHFESTPLTSIESAQKVIDLTEKLSHFAPKNKINLHMVPFKELHEQLLEYVPEAYNITIMRRMMYRISEQIAAKHRCLVLINGESVGQVASQTLQSMVAINDVTTMPVLRPLVTYDKLDIIDISNKIDCYDISVKPFEDCCTVYVPKKPTTSPKVYRCEYYETLFDYKPIIDKAVRDTKTFVIEAGSSRDITLEGFTIAEIPPKLTIPKE